jgi:hypothetical protein
MAKVHGMGLRFGLYTALASQVSWANFSIF